ncbi:hypothetical protein [Schleiferilactobacillus harbinensis]|uniref:Uncharacterized protein n=1 Tax=Schleiferilactobacillus harbinensis TaxID=304207 RepID=A0A5P8M3W8_9LACO|nr:hypothetical protein [Schleiferilactobacillus harbinensis]QFR23208.1 hypothetical protein D1010_07225 [Schleiferilactobacillus harbinensis]QFR23718.1 hypothetical protein D1010_10035 [Schleiferilactobacillus harbinensis]
MNKYEAKMKIFNKLSKMDMPADDFVEMVHMVGTTVDAIEPDKLYRVKVYAVDLPAVWYRKRDDGTLSFLQGDPRQPATEFTTAEIKLYHLENCEREVVASD